MHEQEAVRRLVKSPPELWAQCSDAAALSRHLSNFGEITITRLEPENTVAWEGESASGTVTLEASGWGTKVRLTATPPAAPASAGQAEPAALTGPAPTPAPMLATPVLTVTPSAAPRGFSALFGTLLKRRREIEPESAAAPMPASAPAPEPEVESAPAVRVAPLTAPAMAAADLLAALEAALDSLGQAHHRPYSRA